MTDKLIPLLKNIKTKEPSVILAALAVYAEMGKRLGHEVLASDILPALWPMTVGVLLNLEQVLACLGERCSHKVQPATRRYSRTGNQSNTATNPETPGCCACRRCIDRSLISVTRQRVSWSHGRNDLGLRKSCPWQETRHKSAPIVVSPAHSLPKPTASTRLHKFHAFNPNRLDESNEPNHVSNTATSFAGLVLSATSAYAVHSLL